MNTNWLQFYSVFAVLFCCPLNIGCGEFNGYHTHNMDHIILCSTVRRMRTSSALSQRPPWIHRTYTVYWNCFI